MEYGYKPTTNGRALLTACAATEKPLKLTRVAVGSGTVPEGTNLADVHELIHYVADGTIGERRHENDRLYLTIQYANISNPDVKTFALSEFIVYAQHPETGEETDVLYATLGDYQQPVPAYNQSFPACVFSFPLILVLSDEIEVSIDAPAGLVTYEDFSETVETVRKELLELVEPYAANEMEFTVPSDGWTQIQDADGNSWYYYDIPCEEAVADGKADVSVDEAYQEAAARAGLSATADVHPGYIRLWSETGPDTEIVVSCSLLSEDMQNGIAAQIAAHNADQDAHSAAISAAVDKAVTALLDPDNPDSPVVGMVESVIQEMLESGEVVGEETVRSMLQSASSGGGVTLATFDFAIPVSAWAADEAAADSYVYYADMANDLVSLTSHIPDVTLDKTSLDSARACGMSPGADILEDGKVRVYAQKIPAAEISGTCRLWAVGAGTGSGGGEGGGGYTMPVASHTTLGGVIIGDGMDVSEDGTITPDVLTSEEIDEIIGGS